MKKRIALLITFLSFGYVQAQAPAIEWKKLYGGSAIDSSSYIQNTNDGGYIFCSTTTSNDGDISSLNHGEKDSWIVKVSHTGAIQWQKSFGGSGKDIICTIQNTPDGGYILGGRSTSNDGDVTGNHGGFDFWIVKLTASGDIQWQKSLGGSGDEQANFVQVTSDGGYILAGHSKSTDGDVTGNHGRYDCWIVKLDGAGVIQWQKSFGGSGDEWAYSVQTTSDNGYVVACVSNSTDGDVTGIHGNSDCWILKLDASGNMQWQKTFGGSFLEVAYDIKTTPDGGYVFAGYSESNDGNVSGNHGGWDHWVVKLDAAGNLQWQKSLGGSDDDLAYSIVTTSDGGYVVAGQSYSTDGDVTGNHGDTDSWVYKLNADGTLLWEQSLGGSGADGATAIQTTAGGGYIVAGLSNSTDGDVTDNHGSDDVWIVKFGPDELIAPHFQQQTIVVYPNPVCEVIQLQTHSIEKITAVKIIALDGKIVIEQNQDNNSINVQHLAKGNYILEAYTDKTKYVSKFIKE